LSFLSPLSLFERYRRLSLGVRILVFLVAGVLLGLLLGERAAVVEPVGDLFIRLLMMSAIPLVFFNLLAAISGMTDVRLLGRLGVKIFVYYSLTSAIALALGIALTLWLEPGVGVTLQESAPPSVAEIPKLADILLDLVPRNVVGSFVDGNVGQIVVFAVLLGIACLLLPPGHRERMDSLFQSAAELFRALVALVLRVAPLGIGALAATTVGRYGSGLFGPLARFIAANTLGQVLVFAGYLLLLRFGAATSPLEFLRKTGPLYATTAATCSSLASLAVSLELAEKRLHLPRAVYAFTLPLGAQINKDGTAILLGSVLVFTAQASGIPLDWGTLASVLLVGLVLSEGSAGIPGGGFVTSLVFVKAFGLPLSVAVIVGGIYRLIDVGITTINCMGDLVGTLLVMRSEGLPFEVPARSEPEHESSPVGAIG
jgi:Na+/H+-dicarboxylate symporter